MGCACLFTIGAIGQKLGCDTLEDPESSEIYVAIEEALNEEIHEALNSTEFNNTVWSLPEILDLCENDTSIYYAFKLDTVYADDLDEIRRWRINFNIPSAINDLNNEVYASLDATVEDLTLNTTEEQVMYEAADNLGIIQGIVNSIIIDKEAVFDSQNYASFLEEYNAMISDGTLSLTQSDKDTVNGQIADVNTAQGEFDTAASEAETSVTTLQGSLLYGNNDLASEIAATPNKTHEAADYLDEGGEGRDRIIEILDESIDGIVNATDGYVNYALDVVEDEMGRCRPAWEMYEGVINMLCYKTLDPYNWTWAGMGLLLLLFVPVQAIAMWMANTLKHYPEGVHPQDIGKKDGECYLINRSASVRREDVEQESNTLLERLYFD